MQLHFVWRFTNLLSIKSVYVCVAAWLSTIFGLLFPDEVEIDLLLRGNCWGCNTVLIRGGRYCSINVTMIPFRLFGRVGHHALLGQI